MTDLDRPGPATALAPAPAALRAPALAVLLLGNFMVMIDYFIVNVAIPSMSRDLDASADVLELVVAGYGLTYAALLVVGGRLGDGHGRRTVFQLGLIGFIATSLLCAVAPTIETLLVGRVLQGVAAGITVPQVLATIHATSDGARRGRALALFGMVGASATALGQLCGGLLMSANVLGLGWRAVFLINLPIGIAVLLASRRLVPDSRSDTALGLDGPGAALLCATIAAFLVPLSVGRAAGWPLWSWALLALTPVLALVFWRNQGASQAAGRTPLMPPALLRIPQFRLGLGIAVCYFLTFAGTLYVLTIVLQQGLGLTALQSGLCAAPMPIAMAITSVSTSRVVNRYGSRVIVAGGLVNALGVLVVIATIAARWPDINALVLAPGMVISGIGQAFIMAPLFRSVLSHVSPAWSGAGAGVLVTVQQTSMAVGVAVLGTLFLDLSQIASIGLRDAWLVALGVQAAAAVLLAALARRLA